MALQCDAIAVCGIHVAPNAEKDSRLEVLALLRASDTWVRVEVVTTLDRESDGSFVPRLLQAVVVVAPSVQAVKELGAEHCIMPEAA